MGQLPFSTFATSKAYIHLIQKSGYNPKEASGAAINVSSEDGNEVQLREGDGAYIHAEVGKELKVQNNGETDAELVLFDIE